MNNGRTIQIPLSDGDKVAETIYEQLKASHPESCDIFEMLGVRKMVKSEDSLTLKLSGVQKINTIVIKYNKGRDLYDLQFWNCRILNREPFVESNVVHDIKGVFCGKLAEAILFYTMVL